MLKYEVGGKVVERAELLRMLMCNCRCLQNNPGKILRLLRSSRFIFVVREGVVNSDLGINNLTVSSDFSYMGRGSEEKLSVKRDEGHVLFGGIKILQYTPDKWLGDPTRSKYKFFLSCSSLLHMRSLLSCQWNSLYSCDCISDCICTAWNILYSTFPYSVRRKGVLALLRVDVCYFDETGTLESDDMVGDPLEKAALKGIDSRHENL
ncbi:hypothetical protein TIFTF001_001464 [Ficus carica]|uniref:Uncharacterized protein n=1 Tax=Ficus carica TaxID=3494 RepID=A0AA87Z7C1_FICCA|nr:hypothetical protein TIFTF001_001464 [Ficus carica]